MRVLLRTHINGVGRRGDIVEVSGGFARNYLFPSGDGMLATKSMESQAAAMRKTRDMKEAHSIEAAQTQAQVINGATVRIEARAGDTGKLFGSVGPHELAEAIQAQLGVTLDRHQFESHDHIKEIGKHSVLVHLFADVSAEFSAEVVAQA